MNYCRKCQSDYEKPGTCNCFAPQAAQFVPNYWPWQPLYPPYRPDGPWIWYGGATSGYAQTETGDVPATTATVTTSGDFSEPTTWVDLSKWGQSMMGGDTSHMVSE